MHPSVSFAASPLPVHACSHTSFPRVKTPCPLRDSDVSLLQSSAAAWADTKGSGGGPGPGPGDGNHSVRAASLRTGLREHGQEEAAASGWALLSSSSSSPAPSVVYPSSARHTDGNDRAGRFHSSTSLLLGRNEDTHATEASAGGMAPLRRTMANSYHNAHDSDPNNSESTAVGCTQTKRCRFFRWRRNKKRDPTWSSLGDTKTTKTERPASDHSTTYRNGVDWKPQPRLRLHERVVYRLTGRCRGGECQEKGS